MQPAHTPPRPSLTGLRLFNQYEVTSLLEQGARGESYVAVAEHTGREAVARFLSHPVFLRSATVTWSLIGERFQLLCELDHPHVERVLTGGVVRVRGEDLLVVVTEHIAGRTLQSVLRAEGRLSVRDALTVAYRVGLGLEAAHTHGVVHGDLRAAHVLLLDRPPGDPNALWPVLTDVGVNNLLVTALGGDLSVHDLAWAPESCAPEQIRGEPVTEATDVYALGLLLYRMLTGGTPFRNDSASEILVAQLSRPPLPLAERAPGPFSDALEAVVARCLAKRPEERFESMSSLLDALEALGRNEAPVPAPAAPRKPTPLAGAMRASAESPVRASSPRLIAEAPMPKAGRARLRAPTMKGPVFHSAEHPQAEHEPSAPHEAAAPAIAAPHEPTPQHEPTRAPRDVDAALRRLRPLAVTVVCLTFVCGALTGWLLATLSAPPPTVATLAAVRPAPRPVRVRVHSNAPGARVTLRGNTYAVPAEVELPPSDVAEMLEVSAPGYETRRSWMRLDEPVDSQVQLAPVAPSPAPAADPDDRRARRHRGRAGRTRRARSSRARPATTTR